MMKRSILAGTAICFTVLFLLTACPMNGPKDSDPILPETHDTWTLEQVGGTDGEVDSTGIRITFTVEVDELAPHEVTVSGAATVNADEEFVRSENSWTIPITVHEAGSAWVTVKKDGIEEDAKPITVYKQGQTAPNAWFVTANGAENRVSSTMLNFSFDKDVALNIDDITITHSEGRVSKGDLSGGGKNWSLGIAVSVQGNILITIDRNDVAQYTVTVKVYYAANFGIHPEKPRIIRVETAIEFTEDVDLKNPGNAADDPEKTMPTIALNWEGAGATHYNVYWSDEGEIPSTPGAANITDHVYFINKGLEEDTDYYCWVEAINSAGAVFSDVRNVTTRKKGPHDLGGVERGDYPRDIRVEPANGQLTVMWTLPDRVGWHEIYYAPAGAVKHVDAYNPISFKWTEVDYTDTYPSYTPYVTAGEYDPVEHAGWIPLMGGAYYFAPRTQALYPFESPRAAGTWRGYWIGKESVIDGDTRPVLGINQFGTSSDYINNPDGTHLYPDAGAFPYIFESWKEGGGDNDLGKLQPYTRLHSAFAQAIPWDGVRAGTPGSPIRYYKNAVTITGLTNGVQYEVWIRCPNVNGERGYGYAIGTPGSSGLPTPANITVTPPAGTTRELEITWDTVDEATGYRLYFSAFNQTPNAASPYTFVASTGEDTYTVSKKGLTANTEYYIWVAAESNGVAGEKGTAVVGRTGVPPESGILKPKYNGGDPAKGEVKTLMYIEVNDHNPLNAGSYILEDGAYLFDYVVLFAANIRNRNCALETTEPHGCAKNGPHLHLNDNVRHVLQNKSKYIEPLQAKGIKVLLGLLGDHDGIAFSTMSDADIATFMNDVKQDVALYGLDGIDFDDEWASKEAWDMIAQANNPTPTSIWTYPVSNWGWPFSMTIYRDPAMGVVPGNGTTTAPSDADMARMWRESGEIYLKTLEAARAAMPDKIITLYEYNTGRYISPDAGGTNNNGTATAARLAAAANFTLQPWYDRYIADSANHLPHAHYGPLAMDVGGQAYASQNGAPNPPMNTIGTYAAQFKQSADDGDPYGYICFYGLNPAGILLKQTSSSATATIPKEEYISLATEIIFGQKTLVTAEGGDYRKDW